MRDVQRLAAAHREAGDRAVLAVGQHAVVLLDVRHEVASVKSCVNSSGAPAARSASAPARPRRAPDRSCARPA